MEFVGFRSLPNKSVDRPRGLFSVSFSLTVNHPLVLIGSSAPAQIK